MARAPRKIKVPGENQAPAPVEIVPQRRPLEPDLPDANDIDSSTIIHSVLTKQGWVCPRK